MVTEMMIIRGRLASADVLDWIVHRARKLGLRGGIVQVDAHAVETVVAGPVELIDAMEVGCSLGPTSVEVERIDRRLVDFEINSGSFAYCLNDPA